MAIDELQRLDSPVKRSDRQIGENEAFGRQARLVHQQVLESIVPGELEPVLPLPLPLDFPAEQVLAVPARLRSIDRRLDPVQPALEAVGLVPAFEPVLVDRGNPDEPCPVRNRDEAHAGLLRDRLGRHVQESRVLRHLGPVLRGAGKRLDHEHEIALVLHLAGVGQARSGEERHRIGQLRPRCRRAEASLEPGRLVPPRHDHLACQGLGARPAGGGIVLHAEFGAAHG
ncbi:hypothetical protein GRI75_09710 [Altererythrobacter soli]|uniref:Uncharacterized protein n=1 Tax=Croceibacterium soli TaxID=1739690 RepID=A0A6I4UY70_9SPHN|nr:hypothetical protein [Croceibacterium soli]